MKTTKGHPDGRSIPLVIEPAVKDRDVPLTEIRSWLFEERRSLERELLRSGAVLLRGFEAIRDAGTFETIVGAISSRSLSYDGGITPRSVVRNRVFTSTSLPPFLPIEPHQEMSYQAEFPDKVAFFCHTPPESGGETPIADMRAVLRALPPDLVRRFDEKGLRLRRRLPSRGRVFAGRTWQETFQTESRAKVQELAESRGWQLEWRGDSLLVDGDVRPATMAHPATGERVWFNQAHVTHKSNLRYWARRHGDIRIRIAALVAPLSRKRFCCHQVHGDGTEIPSADLDVIRSVLGAAEVTFRWRRGDVLLLDNVLTAHGRRRFRGRRRILAALLKNEDRLDD